MKKISSAIFLCSSFVAANSYAEQGVWKGNAELGVVTTSGNTETSSINAKLKASRESAAWVHTGRFEGLGASDNVKTSAERYFVEGKSDYKIGEFDYVFGLLNHEKDRFSGFDHQSSAVVGYGRKVIHQDDMSLSLEAGAGYRDSETDAGSDLGEAIVTLGGDFQWTVSETSKFQQVLKVESGSDITVTKSVTSLTSQVADSLAMKATLTVKNTSDVPVGKDKTDTETAVSLVYSF